MMEVKDYLVQVRVRSGPFKRAMQCAGFKTAVALSRACGVHQAVIGKYFGLQYAPYAKRSGELTPDIIKIAAVLKCHPDSLFPERHLHDPLKTNSSNAELNLDEVQALAAPSATLQIENEDLVFRAIDVLNDREQRVIEMRFGLYGPEETLRDIGDELGVTSERIRQMEFKARRKMRRHIQETLNLDRQDVFTA